MLLALKLPFSRKYFSCISKAVFLAESKDVYFVINFNFFFGKNRRPKSVICLFQVFLRGVWFWILCFFGIMSSTYYSIIANLLKFEKIFNFLTCDEWLDWIEKKTPNAIPKTTTCGINSSGWAVKNLINNLFVT